MGFKMKCKKHQWDYIGNRRIGENEVWCDNPEYAIWICPYCKEKRLIELSNGRLDRSPKPSP